MIFGVADDGSVIGVENCKNRKKQCHVLNLLKDAQFNRLPNIKLHTVHFGGHEIDILEIENRPDKPYFLKKDYAPADKTLRDKTLRAGVTYTRYGDTNTPLMECADELFLERMFRERFGIDKPPLDKVKINLREFRNWQYSESDSGGDYFYDEWNPEFTLIQEIGLSSEKFVEGWTQSFPDSNAFKHELLLKFHSTVLRRLNIVSCDGARYLTVLPKAWSSKDEETGKHFVSYFFINNSIEYLVNKMIQHVHPMGIRNDNRNGCSYNDGIFPFSIFESEEHAKVALQQDFEQGMKEYFYYSYNSETRRYIRSYRGQHHEILTC